MKYRNNNFDIIIMYISLKGTKNALELVKEIKAVPSYTGTPMLYLTANAQTKMRQTAIESGTDLLIIKPVSNRVLKEAFEFHLKPK